MSRILHRQLIGHEDFALGHGKVIQQRGPETLQFQQIELEFIFRTPDEIKAIDFNRYTHVAIHTIPEGAVDQYYYDPFSHLIPDDFEVIKPNSVQLTQGGRYIRVIPQQLSLLDTIIASCSDELTPLEVATTLTTFRAPYALTLAYIRCSLTTAPIGADLIVDVKVTGVTVFSTPMHIDSTERTSVTAITQAVLNIINIVDDTEFTVDVLQIGSSTAGTGLKVAVTGTKVI